MWRFTSGATDGRLNDLRHLVYKSFSANPNDAALNFGVMIREGLLKENIDGEAILWATSRLLKHRSAQRILFVISDGAPIDDSTLSVNPGNFLEKHLEAAVDSVSTFVTVYAIGVHYNGSRYYPNSVLIDSAEQLGLQFFETLVNDPGFLRNFDSLDPKMRYRISD